nr:hypothetical protein [Marinicella sp. W31]MDC2877305.1 hypothetical protein [Marinicella sp. W31]
MKRGLKIAAGVLAALVIVYVAAQEIDDRRIAYEDAQWEKQQEADVAESNRIAFEAYFNHWQEKNLKRSQASFADAPPLVKAVVHDIVMGQPVTDARLAVLGKQEINRGYPETPEEYGYKHGFTDTLLREAVLSRNYQAAEALVRHGADVNYNGGEMAFTAVGMKTNFTNVISYIPYPDFQFGNQFLTLYLENSGDPNAYKYDGMNNLVSAANGENNLQGVLILLANKADPWFEVPDGKGYFYSSFFVSNANAGPWSCEMAFRVALQGYYDNAPPAKLDQLLKRYQTIAAQYIGVTGPSNLFSVWQLQRVLELILKGNHVEPTGAIAELMAMKVPDDIGGFILAPGQLWSPPDSLPLNKMPDGPEGTERWDGQ